MAQAPDRSGRGVHSTESSCGDQRCGTNPAVQSVIRRSKQAGVPAMGRPFIAGIFVPRSFVRAPNQLDMEARSTRWPRGNC